MSDDWVLIGHSLRPALACSSAASDSAMDPERVDDMSAGQAETRAVERERQSEAVREEHSPV